VNDNDVVADVGAAEGNFSLSVVELAKKIYLFEADKNWIPALKKTFEPWSYKVVIVNKYVENKNTENSICLDDFFREENINFLKADVESAEISLLQGAHRLLSNQNIKIAVCTYYKQHDAEAINKFLMQNKFYTEFSKGYMLFLTDKDLAAPYLRKALIRATYPLS
jgi:hypothetical protein